MIHFSFLLIFCCSKPNPCILSQSNIAIPLEFYPLTLSSIRINIINLCGNTNIYSLLHVPMHTKTNNQLLLFFLPFTKHKRNLLFTLYLLNEKERKRTRRYKQSFLQVQERFGVVTWRVKVLTLLASFLVHPVSLDSSPPICGVVSSFSSFLYVPSFPILHYTYKSNRD